MDTQSAPEHSNDDEPEYEAPTLESRGRLSKIIQSGGGPSSDTLGSAS